MAKRRGVQSMSKEKPKRKTMEERFYNYLRSTVAFLLSYGFFILCRFAAAFVLSFRDDAGCEISIRFTAFVIFSVIMSSANHLWRKHKPDSKLELDNVFVGVAALQLLAVFT